MLIRAALRHVVRNVELTSPDDRPSHSLSQDLVCAEGRSQRSQTIYRDYGGQKVEPAVGTRQWYRQENM